MIKLYDAYSDEVIAYIDHYKLDTYLWWVEKLNTNKKGYISRGDIDGAILGYPGVRVCTSGWYKYFESKLDPND